MRPRKYGVVVEWKGHKHYYESVENCAVDMGVSAATIYNYLNGLIQPPLKLTFKRYMLSGEERLLREALKVEPDEKDVL